MSNCYSNNFESAYAALFTALQNAIGFNTYARRLQSWAEPVMENMPAMFMKQIDEVPVQSRGLPTKWMLHVNVYIYCMAPDSETSGATVLNPLLGAIRDALQFDPFTGTQTLGDTVSHCWIYDRITIDEGVQDNLNLAMIPIEILVTK